MGPFAVPEPRARAANHHERTADISKLTCPVGPTAAIGLGLFHHVLILSDNVSSTFARHPRQSPDRGPEFQAGRFEAVQRILLLPCRLGARCRGLVLLALFLLLLSPASGALAQRAPKVLPPLDGDTDSVAMAINNRGETAGISGIGPDLYDTAVTWDRKGTPRALLPLPGDPHSEALGINKRGEVAGNSGVFDEPRDSTASTAVRWDRTGVAMALPPLPGGDGSRADGINAAGEVVGTSTANGERTAVIWDRDGLPRALAPLPGYSASLGKAINTRGMVAGLSGGHAVIWSRDGTP